MTKEFIHIAIRTCHQALEKMGSNIEAKRVKVIGNDPVFRFIARGILKSVSAVLNVCVFGTKIKRGVRLSGDNKGGHNALLFYYINECQFFFRVV